MKSVDRTFPILAIETTGEMCSISALLDEKNFVEVNHLQKHIHSEKLMQMVDAVVNQVGASLKEFAAIAVSLGPGSFTGLRIGMSAAKGLAFGADLGIIAVPTFNAFALQLSEFISVNQTYNIIINASIDDCYLAKYKRAEKYFETLLPLSLITKDELEKSILDGEINFGNLSLDKYVLKDVKLTANSVARWAYLFGKDLLTFDYENLEPNYLKEFVGKVKK